MSVGSGSAVPLLYGAVSSSVSGFAFARKFKNECLCNLNPYSSLARLPRRERDSHVFLPSLLAQSFQKEEWKARYGVAESRSRGIFSGQAEP